LNMEKTAFYCNFNSKIFTYNSFNSHKILKLNLRKMKKTILTLVILVFAAANIAQAQNLQDVLDKHFKAIGQEKLSDIETYRIKAKVEQMGMEIPMDMKMKRPDKFRMEMEMQGQKMIRTYNGEKGWMLAPWVSSEPQALTGAELEQAMTQADIDGELYNYEKKGFTAELLGKEFSGDAEVFNIKLTGEDGVERNYYINTDSYLVHSVKGKVEAQGQEITIEQIMGDYKDFDGIKMATKIEQKSPMGSANIIFEEIEFGVPLADSIFEKP